MATSTAWLWVKHLPLDPDSDRARQKSTHAKLMTDAQWERRRGERDAHRSLAGATAAAEVGALSARELTLIGAVAYWCEGAKAKPWRPHDCRVIFTNSDPVLIAAFLAFAEANGRPRDALTYRVNIHESAEPAAAQCWWAEQLGLPADRFRRPTLKRGQPAATNRLNVGRDYHGCLVVTVPRPREFYWRIEGLLTGLATELSGLMTSPADRLR